MVISFVGLKNYLTADKLPDSVLSAQKAPDHVLVFLGDSMTEHLGNFDELRAYLKEDYPQTNFLLLNYGYGSTNVVQALDRIDKESTYSGRIFMPINDIPFSLIFIESFGHNPLSHFSLEEGLQAQNKALDHMIAALTAKHPLSSIVFVATIAPNDQNYALKTVDLSREKRRQWAEERSAYIKNHLAYAKARGIPVVDVYSASLNLAGTGNMIYISNSDFIHPSPNGVFLVSEEIAEYIRSRRRELDP